MRTQDTILLEHAYQQVYSRIISEDNDTTYTVQSGDNLSSIAHRFNVDFEELKKANGITDPTSITVGRELVLPKGAGAVSDKAKNFINSLPSDQNPEDEVHEAPVGYNADGYIIMQPEDNLPLSRRKPADEQGGYDIKNPDGTVTSYKYPRK